MTLLSLADGNSIVTEKIYPDRFMHVAELNRRSERGFDPAAGATALPHEVRPPAGEFFVAYLHGEAVGCGAVKHHKDAPAEIKRMWIAPQARGLGLGRRPGNGWLASRRALERSGHGWPGAGGLAAEDNTADPRASSRKAAAISRPAS